MKIKSILTTLIALSVSLTANATWTYSSATSTQVKIVGPFAQKYECDNARNFDMSDFDEWYPVSQCVSSGSIDINPIYVPIYPGPGRHQTPIIPVFPYPSPFPSCQFIDC